MEKEFHPSVGLEADSSPQGEPFDSIIKHCIKQMFDYGEMREIIGKKAGFSAEKIPAGDCNFGKNPV